MFQGAAIGKDLSVIIRIVLDSLSPPLGRVAVEGEDSQAFHGWLGLLSALSRFVDGEPETKREMAHGRSTPGFPRAPSPSIE